MEVRHRAVVWVLGSVLIAAAALACTSARNPGAASAGEPVGAGTCFDVGMVDSFSPVGDRFIYARMTGGEQYLLTLDAVYQSLPFATGFTIFGNFTWVCSNSGARIAFRGGAGQRVVARILGVETVASLDEAKRLATERSAPPKAKAKG